LVFLFDRFFCPPKQNFVFFQYRFGLAMLFFRTGLQKPFYQPRASLTLLPRQVRQIDFIPSLLLGIWVRIRVFSAIKKIKALLLS